MLIENQYNKSILQGIKKEKEMKRQRFFIVREAKETILNSSQVTVKVL